MAGCTISDAQVEGLVRDLAWTRPSTADPDAGARRLLREGLYGRRFAAMLAGLDQDSDSQPALWDRDGWPRLRAPLAEPFARRDCGRWAALYEGTDACVTPVPSYAEAASRSRLKHGQSDGA